MSKKIILNISPSVVKLEERKLFNFAFSGIIISLKSLLFVLNPQAYSKEKIFHSFLSKSKLRKMKN